MEIGVIVTGHGSIASCLMTGVEMVLGKNDNLRVVDFPADANFDDLEEKYHKAYDDLSEKDYILVLCDLLGGTPFNRAYMALGNQENTRFLAGVNFNMVYYALNTEANDIDQLVDEIIRKTRENILDYK